MTNLNTVNVTNTFMACLFKEGEPTDNKIIGEGVRTSAGFHPERLKEAEPMIEKMLDELPDGFKQSAGGGWTFLNACEDKEGNLWTGDHATVDQLVMLGMATNKLSFLMPRDMWAMLPGGMPYIVVNTVSTEPIPSN